MALTHFDGEGNAHMVDVSAKAVTDRVAVDLTPDAALPGVRIEATVKTTGQTGVEMEALTAASVAALTVYDMLKAAEKSMRIEGLRVILKDGGKSGRYEVE